VSSRQLLKNKTKKEGRKGEMEEGRKKTTTKNNFKKSWLGVSGSHL
jgi:hypothetical protein